MIIYIVRHGEVPHNALKQYNNKDEDLNTKGIIQANELRNKIKKIDYDIIISSPLIRAKHTAQIINIKNREIIIDDRMKISGDSVGAGEIRINNIDGFEVNIKGNYDTLLLMYKDKPGMISEVAEIIQKQRINIATLHCDRSSKGGVASMCIELDIPAGDDIVNEIKKLSDVFFVTNVRKLK